MYRGELKVLNMEVIKKSMLLLFGVLLSIIVLEIGLRVVGGIFLSIQNMENHIGEQGKEIYKILCLGESLTANQYPQYLESELNRRNLGKRYKVIDKGMPCTNSDYILANLEYHLNLYKPDMVITMMGMNDNNSDVVFEFDAGMIGYRNLKLYKFLRLLLLHIKSKVHLTDESPSAEAQSGDVTEEESHEYVETLTRDKIEEKAMIPGPGIKGLKNIVKEERKEENIYADIMMNYVGQVDEEKAEEICLAAINASRANVWGYVCLAEFYILKGKYIEANAIVQEMILKEPHREYGYYILGKSYAKQGEHNKAEEIILKGIALSPANKWGYLILKSVYEGQQRYSDVERIYRKLQDINPHDACVAYSMGAYYRRRGRDSEAEALLKEAIRFDPPIKHAYMELKKLYEAQGRYSELANLIGVGMEKNIWNEWVFISLGNMFNQDGVFEEAERAYKKAMEINHQNEWAYIYLGDLYITLNNVVEAEKMLLKAKKINPYNDRVYFYLGRFYKEQSRFYEAEKQYTVALQINPKDISSYFDLCSVYVSQIQFSEAEKIYKKAMFSFPENGALYTALGGLYQHQGNYAQAKKMYEKAIHLNPSDEIALIGMAQCFNTEKKYNLESEYLQRVVQISRNTQNHDMNIVPKVLRKKNTEENSLFSLGLEYNYRKLKNIVLKRGIVLVVMQYPMLDVEPLKKLFNSSESIVFIDNEEVFRAGVRREAYGTYFLDRTGRGFGHCTRKGNQLLAKNIADVLVKKVFIANKR